MNFEVLVYLLISNALILLIAKNKYSEALITRQSPCPGIFSYEGAEPNSDRWYGDIILKVDDTTEGATFRITLDRPSQLLVSWAGALTTNDNRIYIANHDNTVLDGGVTYKPRIMVKYDPSGTVPLLQSVHFNGRRICPPDAPLTLGHPDLILSPQPTASSRPDPVEYERTTESGLDLETRPRPRPPVSRPDPGSSEVAYSTGNVSLNANNCGTVNTASPLITGGQRTQRGQWPWHVALYKSEIPNLNYICGGSLVSKNKVITAAHCLYNSGKIINMKNLIVYLGKHNLRQYTDEQGVETKEVSRMNINPNYNSNNFHGDIAVLTLASDVQNTNYIRPVCIWEQSNDIRDIIGKEGVVAGWGLDETDMASEELKIAKLPVVSTEACLRSYPKFYSEYTSDESFCAGFRNGNAPAISTMSTSPCNGDSGGGLVFKRDSAWYLRGIVSLSVAKEGLNFCNPNYYVIFTDVAKHTDFIRRSLQ